jgi:enamine deaminase RidA (YjgF/YER057c/UK114 family)
MKGVVDEASTHQSRETRALYDGFHFSQANRVGDTIWVSGQVGVDDKLTPAEGMAAQARLAFEGLKRTLAAAGATLDDVVELTTFHTPYGYEDFLPAKTRRIVGVVAKSRAFGALVAHPMIMAVGDALLLPNCASYQICTTAALVPDPGSKAQALYREDQLWNLPSPHPVIEIATMWAISDFTRENGATHLVPGSNSWWDDRTPREDEIVQAEMTRGSLLLWTDHVLHGAGANRSEAPRFGAGAAYILGWLRQEENQSLAVPPEIARTLPENLPRLVGYQLSGGLGFAGELGKDPIEMLRP